VSGLRRQGREDSGIRELMDGDLVYGVNS